MKKNPFRPKDEERNVSPGVAPIAFGKPDLDEAEIEAVAKLIRGGKIGGDGPATKRLEAEMAAYLGVPKVFLTTSGTHALELAMHSLRLKPGDEVICPSFTFVSTANAALLCGAKPVFAEIRPDTLNLCPEDTARRITSRTRAICPVHYAGVACDMDAFLDLAKVHNLSIVEDAAHAIGARYKGKPLGSIGDAGCYSFHDTKNIVCGEGGALASRDPEIISMAEMIREKGTDRSRFLRGEIDKYTWREPGSSYILSEILAVVLEVQWKKMDRINRRRVEVFRRYENGLRDLAEKGRIALPHVPEGCEINGHIFYTLHPTAADRNRCLTDLRERGIPASFHFVPLHSSPFARRELGTADLSLPVTESAARRLVRLPLHSGLTDPQVDYILDVYRDLISKSRD
jgi:dTDP-4-amino-4,6-dideoxygalactose transaminase